ncbi:hypothetical protein CHS0354_041386 [Potamilus streckersoni]|uniref:Chitin-binding type-4 domain-containing protein n=1 Tax=Potamilus streckersoni TaxID=2493646 RepID=A0AAE0TAS8_9BIVA|nr:hypothetical protein CHS0354_041386 [Potamilus streckersoni]
MAFLGVALIQDTTGHGRMIDPPGRSTMWRFNFQTPINYDDHQLSCGGFGVQWSGNNGKCGVCGDPWGGPLDNEAGGKYATGTIAKTYKAGETISVRVQITVNHGGWFEFRLCPNNDPQKRVTRSCLDRNLLAQPNGQNRYQINAGDGITVYTVNLVLPRGLTCSQCVLQWKWNTATNWGCEASGQCCQGCGHQEEFYSCADITIMSSTGSSPYSSSNVPPASANPAIDIGTLNSGNGIGFNPVITPSSISCLGTQIFHSIQSNADDWCKSNCPGISCSPAYCTDACRVTQ